MKKTRIVLLAILSFAVFSLQSNAQDISNLGAFVSGGGTSILESNTHSFTVGDGIVIGTIVSSDLILTQGFLQPESTKKLVQIPTELIIKNNFLTPNGDGKNDNFIIEGLDKFPGNKLTIVSKLGIVVFSATNYQNNWDGMYKGKKLAEDGYLYLFDTGKGEGIIRGVISIVRDDY